MLYVISHEFSNLQKFSSLKRCIIVKAFETSRLFSTKRASNSGSTMNKKEKLLVLGGNGYIGSHICRQAMRSNIEVRSLNRSGKPKWTNASWIDQIDWCKGDVFNESDCDKAMVDVSAVVSTIGAFGNTEFMERMCGDATISAVNAAKKHKNIKRFGFISEVNVDMSSNLSKSFPLYGYLHGKKRAEEAIFSSFPESGFCLRPGFVYGWRRVDAISKEIPLQLMGIPIDFIGSSRLGHFLEPIPFFGKEIVSCVDVDSISRLITKIIEDTDKPLVKSIYSAKDIREQVF